MTSLLGIPTGQAVGVLDDQRRSNPLCMGKSFGQLWAAIALVGADVFLAVFLYDLKAQLLRLFAAFLQLAVD
jgi:hypothetical protein